ncbi:MAG TPA: right-handed parallel beta-helix repeat-containing protein [Acidimicrobiia bacterium]|nr:right-handed parallel beta-helix repeat-containing protein [Acidimicrobiia bacterium]
MTRRLGVRWLAAIGMLASATVGAFPTVARGATPTDLWVDQATAGRGDGSQRAPFRTIGAAIARAAAGTSIHVAAGTYREALVARADGRADAPIVLAGAPGAALLGDAEHSNRGLEVRGDHWQIEGFDVSGQDVGVWVQGATGVVLRNNDIHDTQGECVRMKYFTTRSVIERNRIHDCGLEDFEGDGDGKNGEGIYIGTAPEQLDRNPTARTDVSARNVVRDNVIVTHGNECVDIKEGAIRNVVEHNECSGQRDPDSAGFDARGGRNVFRFNVSTGNVGAGVRLGGDTPSDGRANDVIGNVLVDNGGWGIKAMRTPQGTVCGNVISGNADGAINVDEVTNPSCPYALATPGPRQ